MFWSNNILPLSSRYHRAEQTSYFEGVQSLGTENKTVLVVKLPNFICGISIYRTTCTYFKAAAGVEYSGETTASLCVLVVKLPNFICGVSIYCTTCIYYEPAAGVEYHGETTASLCKRCALIAAQHHVIHHNGLT